MAVKGNDLKRARRKVQVKLSFVLDEKQRDETFIFTHRQITLALRDGWRDERRAEADAADVRRKAIEEAEAEVSALVEKKEPVPQELEDRIVALRREDEDSEKDFIARRLASIELSSPDITEDDGATPFKLDAEYLRELDLGWLRCVMTAINDGFDEKKTTTS